MPTKRTGPKGSTGPRGTQATHCGRPSATSIVEKWLLAGRRCDAPLAYKKWGLTRDAYNAAIRALRRRHNIDTDVRTVTRTLATGTKRRVNIGSHTIVR